MAKKIVFWVIVTGCWLYLAATAMAVYNEVYTWEVAGWVLATTEQARLFCESEDSQQFRFSSSGSPGTSVYASPKAGNPCQFLIENVVRYSPNHSSNPGGADGAVDPLLIAGRDITVGQVWIWNNDENFYLKYQTYPPWYMRETHLYVGTTLPATPIKPGRFPYSHEDLNNVLEDTYTVSLSELGVGPGDWVYIMAHAVVVNLDTGESETAWKEGTQIAGPGGGWARYNMYQIQIIPWLKVSISENELIWDVFKPGNYMALGSVLRIASNVAVAILYGTGGPDSALGPAVRNGSLLPKTPSNPGTPPDEIRLWATCLWGEPSSPHVGDPELVPPIDQTSTNPGDLFGYWIDFSYLDRYQMEISESEELKKGIAFSWYNVINADPSNSEGNYFEQFVITISAEP